MNMSGRKVVEYMTDYDGFKPVESIPKPKRERYTKAVLDGFMESEVSILAKEYQTKEEAYKARVAFANCIKRWELPIGVALRDKALYLFKVME